MASHPPCCVLNPRRILVRGVNWLGDAVMTTPALLRLRERFPGAHIAVLTPEKLRDLWLHHPAVNAVLPVSEGESAFSVGWKVRKENFDVALVLPNSPRSALEVWLAQIPHRIGYARPGRNWLLTARVSDQPAVVMMRKRSRSEIRKRIAANVSRQDFPARSHQIHHYLHLVSELGANPEPLAPQLFVTPIELAATEKKFCLGEKSIAGRPLLALNPGAEYGRAKRWPAERFVAAAQEIQKRINCVWLILGSQTDVPLAAAIQSAISHRPSAILNLAGQTSLRELCSLLKLCRVLLTNDTGPMHVASAVGTPVVVPFGSTSPRLTGPGLPGDPTRRLLISEAPCSPCFRRTCPIDFRCMTGISPGRVVEAVVELILP